MTNWFGTLKRNRLKKLLSLLLAIAFIYMVLASQFNSFVHPFTVLLALPFSISGALSPAIRVRIGEMSGATHLILFRDTFYPGNQSHTVTVRLIALETGEVLASQSTTRSAR